MSTITKERIELFIKYPLENGLTRGEQMELARIALASLAAVSDERAAYELFMEKRFGESVDRRRAKNGDREYMAWDMALGWIIWCHRAAMLQSGNFRENKNSSTNNFREIAETSTNYPVIPSEVLSAILKVAKIRADFDDFDGDRRGIGDCLDEAEQELIVTINKYASQLAAEPIATNDVREQTAVPPVPVIQADVAQAIEKLKRKLVECNRYNYCADAAKGVEYACHAAMLQGSQPVSNHEELPLDYLQGQKDGLEWAAQLAEANHPQTGDWLYDDPLELAKAIRKGPDMPEFDGPTPVTPGGWISCSDRMPDTKTAVLVAREFDRKGDWRMKWATYIPGHPDANDGWIIPGASWIPSHWMPLPEPPQEAK